MGNGVSTWNAHQNVMHINLFGPIHFVLPVTFSNLVRTGPMCIRFTFTQCAFNYMSLMSKSHIVVNHEVVLFSLLLLCYSTIYSTRVLMLGLHFDCLQPVDLQGAQAGIPAGHSADSVCKVCQGTVMSQYTYTTNALTKSQTMIACKHNQLCEHIFAYLD